MSHDPLKNIVLDAEEQEIDDHFDQQPPLPPKQTAKMTALFKNAVINSIEKDQRVGLRINGGDLIKLKTLARKHGLKYQTYIADILHQHTQQYAKEAYE